MGRFDYPSTFKCSAPASQDRQAATANAGNTVDAVAPRFAKSRQ